MSQRDCKVSVPPAPTIPHSKERTSPYHMEGTYEYDTQGKDILEKKECMGQTGSDGMAQEGSIGKVLVHSRGFGKLTSSVERG